MNRDRLAVFPRLVLELLEEKSVPLSGNDVKEALKERYQAGDLRLKGWKSAPQRLDDLWEEGFIRKWEYRPNTKDKQIVFTRKDWHKGASRYNIIEILEKPMNPSRVSGGTQSLFIDADSTTELPMPEDPAADLTILGNRVSVPDEPDISTLETFPAPMQGLEILLKMERDEFTSLCPKTGQPDFGQVVIIYTADEHCVESKSLKLYLQSFRNTPSFGEAIVARIFKDLSEKLHPEHLKVTIFFSPRGGLSVNPSMESFGDLD